MGVEILRERFNVDFKPRIQQKKRKFFLEKTKFGSCLNNLVLVYLVVNTTGLFVLSATLFCS
jgi:hypothetical protein